MGKMMNFGRRTTPLTTDPQGRRIADPAVYGKKIGTGMDQVTVSSYPDMRKAYQKMTPDQKNQYKGSPVGKYLKGETDILDDVNYEEPTVNKDGNFQYTLKKGSPRYNSAQEQYGNPRNRANTRLYLDSGMSQQEWAQQRDEVKYSTNPLIDNPLGEGMQYSFETGNTQDDFRMAPSQVPNIRYNKPKVEKTVKPVAPVKTTANTAQNNVEYTEELTKPAPAPKKPTYTKEELTIKNLKTLPVGKIATQQGRIKRTVDPNEPVYKGAGMMDTSKKGQKVQQETE